MVDGRKVFSVRAFNQGIASWLGRLPTVWVEGEVTELRRQERWAIGVLHAEGSRERRLPRRADAARAVRRAPARARRRRARARLRAPGALRAARRLPPARAHDRALRPRRAPRRARAAEAEARRRGAVRRGAQAAAAADPAADRPRHRQRRGGEARRAHRDHDALPAGARRSSPRRYVQGPRAALEIAAAIAELCASAAST